MSNQTSTEKPKAKPEEPQIPWRVWAGGNGELHVPLAGLLCHRPELHDAILTPSEWSAALDEYLKTPTEPEE